VVTRPVVTRPVPTGRRPVSAAPPARLVGLGSAVPGAMDQQELWDDFFATHFARPDGTPDPRAARIWHSAGVRTRHGVVDPRVEDVTGWTTGQRMRRFVTEAVPLGKGAVSGALDAAGVDPVEVGMFAVASCTGYATPGLDIVLARDLGMQDDVARLAIGHMGCYAALPGLTTVADTARARGLPGVLLCAELTCLHAQPTLDTSTRAGLEQLVAHALFADAAAAAVVLPGGGPGLPAGLEILDSAVHTDVESAALMSWEVTDTGFRMGLSPRVPSVLARIVRPVVDGLLARNGATVDDVAGWAVHPGGPAILDVVADRCGLADDALDASRAVLAEFGNCSSATVLMVTDRMLATREFAEGDLVVLLAFGPGLTLHTVLTRWSGAA
jgi:predicted naringenin-chalcone synthase